MRHTILKILTLFFIVYSSAQNVDVSGNVQDNKGIPIPGVNVVVKNSSKGAVTDFDGNFKITNVKIGETLSFSFIGYATYEKVITDGSKLIIQLQEDLAELDQVVVVGYGSQRKELVSGAFSSLTSEKITESNPARIEEALTGSAAGVQVNANSGSPGASLNIRIRGITTNGDNSPLVIVDGVNIGTDLSIVDPNDIAKMDIIKDASSAIYGVQGANGVILITTKTGKKGSATKFTYNAFTSFQEASNRLDLMNATEYALYVNETESVDGNTIPYTDVSTFGVGTDWQDELFSVAPIVSHSLSATGGSEKITYGITGSLFKQDGIIASDKSNFNRWTIKNNLGIDLAKKLKLNTFLLYTNIKKSTISEGGIGDNEDTSGSGGRGTPLYYALNASPLTSVFDGTDGTGPSRGFSYISTDQGTEIINPLAQIYNTFNETKTNRFTGKLELVYDVIEDLKATSRFNFNYSDVAHRSYTPLQYYGFGKVVNNVQLTDGSFDLDENNNGERDLYSTVYQYNENYFDYTWESFLDYKKSIGSHNFNGLLGAAFRSEQYKGIYATGYLVNSSLDNWDNAFLSNTQSSVYDEDISLLRDEDTQELILDENGEPTIVNESINRTQNANTGQNEDRWVSFFGRLQYDYDGKYLLSAMLRRDASTRFGPNNRVGYFPSVSGGWVVSKEDFFDSSFIDNLKIRGSWGITGNDKIGSYRWIGLLQGIGGEATYPFGNTQNLGNALGDLPNLDLEWETNKQTNIGIDLTLLKNKFNITFDYYVKTTENLLLVPDVSALIGASAGGSSAPVVNAGTIENRGIDLSINFKHDFSENFGIGIGYNLTSIKNEALEVNNAAGFIEGGLFGLNQTTSRFQTGLPIGTFYGLKTDGVFQNQAEIDAHATQAGAEPGDIRYVDVDGDGVVEFGSEDDRTVIGNPIPDFTMGLTLNLDYKQFDLSTSLYASIGNDIARSYERFLTYSNKPTFYLDRWTGEGTSNSVPRASNTASNNFLFSDFYVEDGSYLRIQNIQLGYSLSDNVLDKVKLDKFRIYIATNNPFTFTKYKGYNPDISNTNPLAAGVDLGQYPLTRTYTLGVNMSF